jgi:hypothetical protein
VATPTEDRPVDAGLGARPFLVVGSSTTVEAWSVARLEHEPSGWQLEFRAALRSAVASLIGSTDLSLACAYESPQQDLRDAEEVLFHNLGLDAFAGVAVGGVIFERSLLVPMPPPAPLASAADHYHRYEVTSHRGPLFWGVGPGLATFTTEAVSTPVSASTVWLAARRGEVRVVQPSPSPSPLVLRATVTLPAVSRASLFSVMRPVIEGVLSAFHAYGGDDIGASARALGRHLGERPAAIEQLLARTYDVLGARAVVQPVGGQVMWDPDDDRLVAVDLRVEPGQDVQVRGDLFEATAL